GARPPPGCPTPRSPGTGGRRGRASPRWRWSRAGVRRVRAAGRATRRRGAGSGLACGERSPRDATLAQRGEVLEVDREVEEQVPRAQQPGILAQLPGAARERGRAVEALLRALGRCPQALRRAARPV